MMELAELGKQPISEDKPAGEDVRYEPEFDELQQEIDKLSIASAEGGGIDWNKVISMSTTILAEKSKNIQVATYLATALVKTRELEGVSQGLTVLTDLVDNFWDNLFPPKKRMRGRLNAITWWMDGTEEFFKGFETDPLPEEKITELKTAFQALDQALADKTEDAPVVSRLIDYVDRLPVQATEEPAALPVSETPGAASPQAAPSAGTAAAAPAGEIKTTDDAKSSLDAGLDILVQVSDFWMQQDPSNPLPYRLTRIAAWLTVGGLPMAENGKTMIPPPDTVVRSAIDNLMANKSYSDAAVAAESRVTQYLFWLDLSRITSQALENLGGRYQEAADAVSVETALFVHRLKGLENLSFSDGTPFADHDTKAWLKANALGGGQDAPLSAGADDSVGTEVAEVFGKAKGLIKDKKIFDAIGLLEENLSRGGSGQVRLLWRIALSQLLADAGQPELALPHMDEILAEIEAYKLESWDPKLALSGLKAVYLCLADETGDTEKEKTKMVLDRIARISPAQALHLIKG